MDDAPFGTADDYERAFRLVLPGANRNHVAMLKKHFEAPEHTVTWKELADHVSYNGSSGVNLQYGLFASEIVNQLNISSRRLDSDGKPLDRNGTPWWLWVLVKWAPNQHAETTQFTLRPEVVEALNRIWSDA